MPPGDRAASCPPLPIYFSIFGGILLDTVGLFYVGAVLFINGLMLLGYVNDRSAAVFNLFVGGLQTFTPLYLIITADGDLGRIFGASGIFLFGFTYLYVGIATLLKADTDGIGWYSLWVAIAACGYGLVHLFQLKDVKFGIIWLLWAILWFMFFLLLGLKKNISRITGWAAILISWFTATIPAFLILVDAWAMISSSLYLILTLVLLVVCIYIYAKGRETPQKGVAA